MAAAKPMSNAQRIVLRELSGSAFPGYCDLMTSTGCTSYKAIDWILDALRRRGYIKSDSDGGYSLTDAGRAALAA